MLNMLDRIREKDVKKYTLWPTLNGIYVNDKHIQYPSKKDQPLLNIWTADTMVFGRRAIRKEKKKKFEGKNLAVQLIYETETEQTVNRGETFEPSAKLLKTKPWLYWYRYKAAKRGGEREIHTGCTLYFQWYLMWKISSGVLIKKKDSNLYNIYICM